MRFLKALQLGLKIFRMFEGSINVRGIPAEAIDKVVTDAVAAILSARTKE